MYIAICVLIVGIAVGRLLAGPLRHLPLGRLVFVTVLALLFILGTQIGANELLFAQLGSLGWQALVLTALALAGTILAAWGLQRLIGPHA